MSVVIPVFVVRIVATPGPTKQIVAMSPSAKKISLRDVGFDLCSNNKCNLWIFNVAISRDNTKKDFFSK